MKRCWGSSKNIKTFINLKTEKDGNWRYLKRTQKHTQIFPIHPYKVILETLKLPNPASASVTSYPEETENWQTSVHVRDKLRYFGQKAQFGEKRINSLLK